MKKYFLRLDNKNIVIDEYDGDKPKITYPVKEEDKESFLELERGRYSLNRNFTRDLEGGIEIQPESIYFETFCYDVNCTVNEGHYCPFKHKCDCVKYPKVKNIELPSTDDLWVGVFTLFNEFTRDKSKFKPIKDYKILQDVIDELKTKYIINKRQ